MNIITSTRVRVTITVRSADGTTQERGASYDSLESMGQRLSEKYQAGEIVDIKFHNEAPKIESETTNKSTAHSLTGISATEFTLPTGQELPQLNWETEGHELHVMLREIDQVRNRVSWDTFGEDHREWARAWDKEFFRIRKAMGVFDPYSQTF